MCAWCSEGLETDYAHVIRLGEGDLFGNPPNTVFTRWKVHVELDEEPGQEVVARKVTLNVSGMGYWVRLITSRNVTDIA